MRSEVTRRGFIAMAAVGIVVPSVQALDELDPQYQMLYECSIGTGCVREFWPPRYPQ